MENLVGTKLAGRYNIVELIGMGGMAAVYKAECEMLKRNVAIKVLLENLRDDEDVVKNFNREAQAAARISHNNIISVFDVGEDNGINYMVMELVEGCTLKEYISENGALPWQEVCDFGIQTANALAEAHSHNVIHRDIKPQNIIMTKDRDLKVTDFGIAKAAGVNTITMSGQSAVGSVHYISPEQARGGYTDERSDIYSLGVVLYEMLTGKVPFDGDTAVSVALMHIEKPVPNVLAENPTIPNAFLNIIEKAMAKEQFARYQSAAELIEDLRAVLAGEEIAEQLDDLGATRKMDDEEIERIKEVEYEGKKKKKRKKTVEEKKADNMAVLLAVITVIVLFGILIGSYFMFFGGANLGKVKVPNIVNMSVEDARLILEQKNLGYEEKEEPSDDVDEGRVIRQFPDAGEFVGSGESIEIAISTGTAENAKEKVPDVVGLTMESAIELILNSDLYYSIERKYSDKVEAGRVISQSPAGDTKVPEEYKVVLVISDGKKPEEEKEEEVVVPRILGDDILSAEKTLNDKGLNLGSITYEESSEPAGNVIKQSPEPGRTAKSHTAVTVVVSSGEEIQELQPIITPPGGDDPLPTKDEEENNETER